MISITSKQFDDLPKLADLPGYHEGPEHGQSNMSDGVEFLALRGSLTSPLSDLVEEGKLLFCLHGV